MEYDSIIVGGGLSGLAAGAALANRGKHVLILEQHVTVGGLAAGFTRKGYYFDAGMSRANKASIMMPLKELGIFTDADFAPHRSACNIEGHAIAFKNVREYFDRLAEIFPDEKDALYQLYDEKVKKAAALLEAMMGGERKPAKLGMLFKMPAMIRMMKDKQDFNNVLADYLDKHGKAYQFLCERWEEVNYRGSMNAFMRIGKIYTQIVNDYPIGGFQKLCDRIASYAAEHGAEISTKSKVLKIIVNGGRCTGVEVNRAGTIETLYARNTVSAIDLNKAFFILLGEEHIPKEWADKLHRSELAAAIPILYLGLAIPPERLRERFLGGEELMYWPKVKPYGDCLNDADYYHDAQMVIHSSSIINPAHAPSGKSSVQVYLQYSPREWLGNWGIIDGKKTERYAEIKKMVIEQTLASMEAVLPEIKDRSIIEVCELGTPHTIERFTGSTYGCACGFTMSGDTMNPRERGKFFDRLPGSSNLYFCGQQSCWPGAAGSALSSGMHIADLIT